MLACMVKKAYLPQPIGKGGAISMPIDGPIIVLAKGALHRQVCGQSSGRGPRAI